MEILSLDATPEEWQGLDTPVLDHHYSAYTAGILGMDTIL